MEMQRAVALHCLHCSDPSRSKLARGQNLLLWHHGSFSCDCWRKCRNSTASLRSGVWNRIVTDKGHEGLNITTVLRVAERKRTEGQMRMKNFATKRMWMLKSLGTKQSYKTRPSVWGQTMVPSLEQKRPKAGKLDRWWLLFVDCLPYFLLSVSWTLSWHRENM